MRRLHKTYLSIIAIAWLTILSIKADTPSVTITQQQNFDYYYYAAELALHTGKLDEGMALLQHCLTLQPNHAAANYVMGVVYDSMDSIQLARKHISIATQQDPASWLYAETYISYLADQNKYDEIEQIVKSSLKLDPTNDEAWRIKALLAIQHVQYKKAIKYYNRIENLKGINEMTSVEKFKLYMAINNPKKAVQEIDRLVEEYPTEYLYQVIRGQLYMGQNMPQKAYETYLHVLEKNPENPYVHIALADYHNLQGEPHKATERIFTALQSKHLDPHTKLDIYGKYKSSLNNIEEKQDELENMLKGLCEEYPFEESVHIVYGGFLQQNNQIDSALLQWQNALTINPKNNEIWLEVLSVYGQKQDYSSLLETAEAAHNALPNEAIFLYYKAVTQIMLKQDSAALHTCEQAIALCTPYQRELQGALWNFKGDCHYKLGDLSSTLEAYDMAIKLQPENLTVLNNYAYFLALKGEDLKKAERLSQRTINAEPENIVYLDTYAWILYLQGYHSLAKFYIERAVNNIKDKEDVLTYYEHYGYILLANQQETKAMEAWKIAIELGTEDSYIIETIEKCNNENTQQ